MAEPDTPPGYHRVTYAYPFEFDPAKRLKNWHRLLDHYRDQELSEDKLPAMDPWAWVQVPDERFAPFLCSRDEIYRVGEMRMASNVMATAQKPIRFGYPGLMKTDPEAAGDHRKYINVGDLGEDGLLGLEALGVDDDLKHLHRSKMKFVVYCTAHIPYPVLEDFLSLAPHSRRKNISTDNDKRSKLRPFLEGSWDDAAFILKTEIPLKAVTMRTTLPPAKPFIFPFVGKTHRQVLDDFVESHYAMKGRRHLFSSHVFVLLDEQTATDGNTVQIWSDSGGNGWEGRRCEFGSLMYNLHPTETLMLGLHQMCPEGKTLTVAQMQAERRIGRLKHRESVRRSLEGVPPSQWKDALVSDTPSSTELK